MSLLILAVFILGGCLSHDPMHPDSRNQDVAEHLYQRHAASNLKAGMPCADVIAALRRTFGTDDVVSWRVDGRPVDQADGVNETHYGLTGGERLSILADKHGVVVSVRVQRGNEGAEMVLAPEPPRDVLDAIPSRWPSLAAASDIGEVLSVLGLTDYIHYLRLTESVDMSSVSSVSTFLARYSVPGYRLSLRKQYNGLLVVVFSSPQTTLGWALRVAGGSP